MILKIRQPTALIVPMNDILDLLQRGTCWAGLGKEFESCGVFTPKFDTDWAGLRDVIVSDCCNTAVETLGFWLGELGVLRECRICPVCLDRKEREREEKRELLDTHFKKLNGRLLDL